MRFRVGHGGSSGRGLGDCLYDMPVHTVTAIVIVLALVLVHLGLVPFARYSIPLESYNYPYDTVNSGLVTVRMGKGTYVFHVYAETSMNLSAGCITGNETVSLVNESVAGGMLVFRVECDHAAYLYYDVFVPSGVTMLGGVEVVKRWP